MINVDITRRLKTLPGSAQQQSIVLVPRFVGGVFDVSVELYDYRADNDALSRNALFGGIGVDIADPDSSSWLPSWRLPSPEEDPLQPVGFGQDLFSHFPFPGSPLVAAGELLLPYTQQMVLVVSVSNGDYFPGGWSCRARIRAEQTA